MDPRWLECVVAVGKVGFYSRPGRTQKPLLWYEILRLRQFPRVFQKTTFPYSKHYRKPRTTFLINAYTRCNWIEINLFVVTFPPKWLMATSAGG